jgi:twinkle protein
MVTQDLTPPEFNHDIAGTLVDLADLSGPTLVARRLERESKFATAPFDEAGNVLRFYPQGLSIWSGFPGSGKSTILRQFICHTLLRGSSVFVASLEEDPQDTITRLAACAAGTDSPNAHQVQWLLDAYEKRLFVWAVTGLASHRQLLGTIRALAILGVKHAVIDSLACLDVRNDDFEAQRQLANLCSAVARLTKTHIHLVAHPRKPMKAGQEPDLNDVAGAKELGAIADNVLFIRRSTDVEGYSAGSESTPMLVSVRKQRHWSGHIGDIPGWYHRRLCQFSPDRFATAAKRYLPDDAFDALQHLERNGKDGTQ